MRQDPQPVDRVAAPRKPYQFTVRTFFAVAVWLGLLLAAVTTLKEEETLGTAVLLLWWIAVAELYRRFRATRALLALGSGPVLLLALWTVVLVATDAPSRGTVVLPPIAFFLAYALGWGIVLSVAVIVERGVERWLIGPVCRYRRARVSELPGDPLPVPPSGRLRCAVIFFVNHTLLGLIAMVVSVGTGMVRTAVALLLIGFADLPVVPVYYLMPGIDARDEMPNLILASLVLGGILYAAMGWLVAYLAEPFERRGRGVGPPDGNSSDVSSPPDGRDA